MFKMLNSVFVHHPYWPPQKRYPLFHDNKFVTGVKENVKHLVPFCQKKCFFNNNGSMLPYISSLLTSDPISDFDILIKI